jgi:hypothetical protein
MPHSNAKVRARALALVLATLVIVHAIAAWALGGRAVFTRTPDPALAAMARDENTLTRAFGDAPSDLRPVRSGFALGLVPSGGGLGLISVATLACPALGVAFWAWRTRS